jgi:hypothetical protein
MEDAIRYYSEAITASPKETIDYRLLSNRSLLYLIKKDYANALVDAEKCIMAELCSILQVSSLKNTPVSSVHFCENFLRCLFNTFPFAANFPHVYKLPLIINVGMPQIDDDDLNDALQDSLGVKQIVEILTRFSLFQIYDQDTLSVHRVVQEVIRNDIDAPIQLKRVLG